MTTRADLFQIKRDDVIEYRYTSSDANQTGPVSDAVTYTTTTISRSGTKVDGQDGTVANMSLYVGITDPMSVAAIAREFQSSRLTLTIFSKYGDDYLVTWKGRLSTMRPRTADVEFIFESNITVERRHTLKMAWSRECPHKLYDSNCNVSKATNALDFLVDAVSGNSLRLTPYGAFDSADAAQLFLGMVTLSDDTEPRTIVKAVTEGDAVVITLKNPLPVAAFDDVIVYRGCDKRARTCVDVFDNITNFGGFPTIPDKNPHRGRIDHGF